MEHSVISGEIFYGIKYGLLIWPNLFMWGQVVLDLVKWTHKHTSTNTPYMMTIMYMYVLHKRQHLYKVYTSCKLLQTMWPKLIIFSLSYNNNNNNIFLDNDSKILMQSIIYMSAGPCIDQHKLYIIISIVYNAWIHEE